jgi:plasmid stability protein
MTEEKARKRQLIVRDVPSEVATALRRRAARHGRSAEAEHRLILRDALAMEIEAASFKVALASMPDVGRDEDFVVDRDLPRALG